MRARTKRFIPLLILILCTVLVALVPITALAASTLTITGFDSSDLANDFTATASLDGGNGSASVSGNVITIKATGSKPSCDYVPATTKVELTAKQSISFKCTLKDNVELESAPTVTDNGDGTKTVIVGAGASVVFKVYSDNTTEKSGTVTITDVQAAVSKVPSDCASYSNGGNNFSYLDKAIESAEAGSDKKIVVTKNGAVYHSSVEEKDNNNGEYTKSFIIPSGVTLLIPYDEAGTLYTTEPYSSDNEKKTISTFRELTIPNDTSITVDGTLAVSGELLASNGGDAGIPNGPHGMIKMAPGSSITINSGAGLYCYGFITDTDKDPTNGSGTVLVKNGGTVYECFQLMDYRGGKVSTSSDLTSKKIFPGSQFYVQNVEVPMTLEAGAIENGYTAVYVSYMNASEEVPFIGDGSAFINMINGSVTKRYDGTTDRLIIDLNGDATLAALKIPVKSYTTIDSSKYVLGLNGNITLNINSGSDITVNQHIALLPGAKVTLADGASMTLGTVNSEPAEIHIYGKNQWNNFCYYETAGESSGNSKFVEVRYAPGKVYTRTDADMGDAEVIIGGTVDATNGKLYTSYGTATAANTADTSTVAGPSIRGTASGKIIMPEANADKLAYQYIQNTGAYQIRMVSPYLAHCNAETMQATAGNTYTYTDGYWRCETHTYTEGKHTCDVCGYVTECVDKVPEGETYADHKCDICGETVSECADSDKDSLCDTCGANLCTHENAEEVAEVPATCNTDGTKVHWTCPGCNLSYYVDENDEKVEIGDAEALTAWLVDTSEIGGGIPALGHTYPETPAFAWAEDYTCTATLTCTREGCAEDAEGHTLSETCEVTSETTAATCQTPSEITYTATVTINDTEYSDIKTVTGTSLGSCSYGDVTYEWNEDHSSCTATHTCGTCGESETATTTNVTSDTTDATCTTDGATTYTATFTETWAGNATDTVTIPANGHNWADKVDDQYLKDAATCTTAAVYYKSCSVCGEKGTDTFSSGDPIAHTYNQQNTDSNYLASAATCTKAATYYYSCSCGEQGTVTFENGEPLGHDKTDADKNHICDREDCTEVISTCADYATATSAKAATCSATGNEAYWSCEVCGKLYSDATCTTETTLVDVTIAIDSTAHSWGEWKTTTEATCTAAGEQTRTCAHNSAHTETQPIEQLDHTMTHHEAVDATCTAAGNVGYWSCSTCNLNYSDEAGTTKLDSVEIAIDPNAHDLKTVPAQTATCTQIGWEEYQDCQREDCDYSTYEEIPMLDHDYSEEWLSDENGHWHKCKNCDATTAVVAHTEETVPGYAATCTTPGLTDGKKCSDCGYVTVEQEEIPTSAHTYGEPQFSWSGYECTAKVICSCNAEQTVDVTVTSKVTTEATCTVEGIKTYTATANYNGNTYTASEHPTENIGKAADVHKNTKDEAQVDATCTEVGYTAGTYCSDCQTWISGHEDIPATNHANRYAGEAKDATCTEAGNTAGEYCPDCKTWVVAQETIPATGHKNTETINASEATCGKDGYTGDTYCNDCQTIIKTGETVPATGNHNYTTETERKDSTCSEAGYVVTQCSCGATERTDQPLVDHRYTVETERKEATCTEDGYVINKCEMCTETETITEEATGHSYGEPVINGELSVKTCGVCGDVVTEVVHTTADEIVEIKPGESTDGKAQVTVGTGSMQHIADQNLSLHLDSDLLELVFDNAALKDMLTDHAEKSEIKLVVENTTPADTNDKLVFDIYLSVDDVKQESSNFGEGKVTVTIPLDKLTIGENQTVKVWYVNGDTRTEMTEGFAHDKENSKVTFQTNHFSEYEVEVVNEVVEPTVEVEVKATAGTNGTTVSASLDGTTLTISNTDSTRAYVYLVKYTTDGTTYTTATKNTDGTYTLAEGATKVTVESALLGDVLQDGVIDAGDITLVRREIARNGYLTNELQRLAANVLNDSYIDAGDVTILRREIARPGYIATQNS